MGDPDSEIPTDGEEPQPLPEDVPNDEVDVLDQPLDNDGVPIAPPKE